MTTPTPPDRPHPGIRAVTPPAQIAIALALLDGVAANPDHPHAALAAATAIAHLSDVHPPYAPSGLDPRPLDPARALPRAVRHLRLALTSATTVPEVNRIADALDEIRTALTPSTINGPSAINGPGDEP